MISTDPIDCLVEIVDLAVEHMSTTDDIITPEMAVTLGKITGVACRPAPVMQRLRERDEQ